MGGEGWTLLCSNIFEDRTEPSCTGPFLDRQLSYFWMKINYTHHQNIPWKRDIWESSIDSPIKVCLVFRKSHWRCSSLTSFSQDTFLFVPTHVYNQVVWHGTKENINERTMTNNWEILEIAEKMWVYCSALFCFVVRFISFKLGGAASGSGRGVTVTVTMGGYKVSFDVWLAICLSISDLLLW